MSVSSEHNIGCAKFYLSHTVSKCLCHNLFIVYTQQWRSMPARIPRLTSSIDSTLAADCRDLTSVIVWPTEEKSRSNCAELALMQYIRQATSAIVSGIRSHAISRTRLEWKAASTRIVLYLASSPMSDPTQPMGQLNPKTTLQVW